MNGRLEKELIAENKMKAKLRQLPNVFEEFYYAMAADGKSYTTMNNYINHNVDFMNYVTNGRPNTMFFANISANKINQYMMSIRRRNINGNIVRAGDDICAAR